MYKIIGADGKEYGPITADQLRQWVSEGRANLQTQVLPEGATEWKTLGELPGFGAAPAAAPGVLSSVPMPGLARPDQVNGPATGLMVVAILGVILQIVSLMVNLLGASFMAGSRMPREAWANMFSGTVGVVSNIVGILVGGLVLFGAMKMKKLESYGLAMTASIVAMIPCISPCCLIGIPIGIWAVIVLSKPEVEGSFH